jgi:hypothetical protein
MIASAAAVRKIAQREMARNSLGGIRTLASLDAYSDFGKAVFTGTVADEYLKKHGASGAILKDPSWTKNHADTVANAVFDWYVLLP